jgi:hypothetical protein
MVLYYKLYLENEIFFNKRYGQKFKKMEQRGTHSRKTTSVFIGRRRMKIKSQKGRVQKSKLTIAACSGQVSESRSRSSVTELWRLHKNAFQIILLFLAFLLQLIIYPIYRNEMSLLDKISGLAIKAKENVVSKTFISKDKRLEQSISENIKVNDIYFEKVPRNQS